MGVNAHLRWVAVAATVLGLAAPSAALAAGPAGPDAAPSSGSSGSGPAPDPAPSRSSPKTAVVAKRSVAVATTQSPVQTTSTPASSTAPPATTPTPRKAAVRKHRAATPKRSAHRTPAVVHAPALPKLDPTRLVAPATNADDAGRARKLAAGALSLLILSLASALLLAVVARGDRRRVAR